MTQLKLWHPVTLGPVKINSASPQIKTGDNLSYLIHGMMPCGQVYLSHVGWLVLYVDHGSCNLVKSDFHCRFQCKTQENTASELQRDGHWNITLNKLFDIDSDSSVYIHTGNVFVICWCELLKVTISNADR